MCASSQDGHTLSHYSIKDGDKLFVAVKPQCEEEGSQEGKKEKGTESTAEKRQSDKDSVPVADSRDRVHVNVLPDIDRKCADAALNLPVPVPPHLRGGCWKPKTTFWEKLNVFLLRHFAPDDVDKITKIVREVSNFRYMYTKSCYEIIA